jgi:hypothetical protein
MSDRQPHRQGVDQIIRRPFLRMTGIVGVSTVFVFRLSVQQARFVDGADQGGQRNAPNPTSQSSRPRADRVYSASAPYEIYSREPLPSWLSSDPYLTASVVENPASSFCSGALNNGLLGQSNRPLTLGGAVLCRNIC